MVVLTEQHVTSSLYQWFSTQYGGDLRTEPPAEFDPNADDLDTWCEFYATTFDIPPHRRSGCRVVEVVVNAMCHSRNTGNIYSSSGLAAEVASILHQAVIPVYDYSTSGSPKVGTLTLWETRTNRQTQKDAQWESHLVTVEGKAEPLL